MPLELLLAAAVAFVTSSLLCGALRGASPMDIPTEPRKHHKRPTPTSGGLGMALGYAVGLIALATTPAIWPAQLGTADARLVSGLGALAFAFGLLGFIDDARPLPAKPKFLVFALLSIMGALSIGVVRALPIAEGVEIQLGLALGLMGTALWVFTLVNGVNFMDGANGLAIGCVAIGLAFCGLIGLQGGSPAGAAVGFLSTGATAGFLLWNFPNGRLFAGDSGALFCGALAAFSALLLIHRADLSAFAAPLLFFPLLADVLLTLAWRVKRRRSVFDGHNEHLYQIMIRAGWSHRRVALVYWGLTGACGALALMTTRLGPAAAWLALGFAAAVSIFVAVRVRAFAKRRDIAQG